MEGAPSGTRSTPGFPIPARFNVNDIAPGPGAGLSGLNPMSQANPQLPFPGFDGYHPLNPNHHHLNHHQQHMSQQTLPQHQNHHQQHHSRALLLPNLKAPYFPQPQSQSQQQQSSDSDSKQRKRKRHHHSNDLINNSNTSGSMKQMPYGFPYMNANPYAPPPYPPGPGYNFGYNGYYGYWPPLPQQQQQQLFAGGEHKQAVDRSNSNENSTVAPPLKLTAQQANEKAIKHFIHDQKHNQRHHRKKLRRLKEKQQQQQKDNEGLLSINNLPTETRKAPKATLASSSKSKVKNSKRGSSRYRGVSWHKRDKSYIARVWLQGKSEHLGVFREELRAALVVDEKLLSQENYNKQDLNFRTSVERDIVRSVLANSRRARQQARLQGSDKKGREMDESSEGSLSLVEVGVSKDNNGNPNSIEHILANILQRNVACSSTSGSGNATTTTTTTSSNSSGTDTRATPDLNRGTTTNSSSRNNNSNSNTSSNDGKENEGEREAADEATPEQEETERNSAVEASEEVQNVISNHGMLGDLLIAARSLPITDGSRGECDENEGEEEDEDGYIGDAEAGSDLSKK